MEINTRWLKVGIAFGAALVSGIIPAWGQVTVAPGGFGPGAVPYTQTPSPYQRGFQGNYRRGNGNRNNRAQNQNGLARYGSNNRAGGRKRLPPPPPMKYVADSNVNPAPAIGAADQVYVAAGSRSVAAYDRKTGQRLWTFQAAGAVTAKPAVGSDSTVYITCYDHNVYALDGATGAKKWQFATADILATTPAVGTNGMVYVGAYDHHLYALNSSGALQWKLTTGGPVTSPVVGSDGTVYFGADQVYAVNGNTGKINWTFSDGYVGNASPLLDSQNGMLYVGAFDGTLYALRMENGQERWRFATGTTIVSPPALGTNGLLYVGANRLYALSVRDGQVHWSVGNSGNQCATPVVGTDGTIYAGCSNQLVYALSPTSGYVRWTFPISDGLITAPALGPAGRVFLTQAGSGIVYALDGHTGHPQWRGTPLSTTG